MLKKSIDSVLKKHNFIVEDNGSCFSCENTCKEEFFISKKDKLEIKYSVRTFDDKKLLKYSNNVKTINELNQLNFYLNQKDKHHKNVDKVKLSYIPFKEAKEAFVKKNIPSYNMWYATFLDAEVSYVKSKYSSVNTFLDNVEHKITRYENVKDRDIRFDTLCYCLYNDFETANWFNAISPTMTTNAVYVLNNKFNRSTLSPTEIKKAVAIMVLNGEINA